AASAGGPPLPAHMSAEAMALNKRVAYSLFSHFVGFFTVAHLSSYLTLKLKAAGDELEEKREVLAKLEALNKNIIDSITSGIITTDVDGRITFMNRGAEEITQRRLAAAEGAGIDVFLARESTFLDKVKSHLDRERRFRFESSILRADGTTLYLGISS